MPKLGDLTVPIVAYSIAIGVMMWRAAARVGSAEYAIVGLLGAVAYGLADTLIALNMFYVDERLLALTAPVMPLYWLGQAGIAASARGSRS